MQNSVVMIRCIVGANLIKSINMCIGTYLTLIDSLILIWSVASNHMRFFKNVILKTIKLYVNYLREH